MKRHWSISIKPLDTPWGIICTLRVLFITKYILEHLTPRSKLAPYFSSEDFLSKELGDGIHQRFSELSDDLNSELLTLKLDEIDGDQLEYLDHWARIQRENPKALPFQVIKDEKVRPYPALVA